MGENSCFCESGRSLKECRIISEGSGYIIEILQPDDKIEHAKVHWKSFKKAYGSIMPRNFLEKFTLQNQIAFVERKYDECDDTFVLKKDGVMIGHSNIGPCRDDDAEADWGEIWGIYLDPDFWSKGLGRLLFQRAMAELKSLGYMKITLWVLEENKEAIGFYEHLGFCRDGKTDAVDFGRLLRKIRFSKNILSSKADEIIVRLL